jgi:two-component system NarL family response regulator
VPAGAEPIRILLAEQHALFREALRTGLEKEANFRVVEDARNSPEAVAAAERTLPDVAILDMDLPVADGIQTTIRLKDRVSDCRVLVLGVDDDCGKLVELLVAGANGYLIKDVPLAELVHATRAIYGGDTLLPPKMLGPLLAELLHRRKKQDRAYQRLSRLTRREREVLALLVEGADNESIARVLVISPQTARTHIQNILGKLSVHSRLEAAAFVTQNGTFPDLVTVDG